jgi:uncharacterized LabA/DUF88 family protein
MATPQDQISMALFCDFENVALGVRDANYEKFDIKRVLERLLLKGSIVVKKAYCDWERYKGFKATMHEANFELIEIPHVRQSGKNSADIRLVVDALDLCYTKSHVNTFVIISGDSDFSPLVSKLRENAKYVIGVGVKQSTSDLLIANCDEFIFYDDLVRESQRAAARREPRDAQPATRRTPEEDTRRRDENDARRSKGVEIAVETFEALVSERGDSGKMWASVLKEAIKRRNPGFSEQYYGFRTFGNLLEEAKARGLLEFGRDEKSGAYVFRNGAGNTRPESGLNEQTAAPRQQGEDRQQADDAPSQGQGQGQGRGSRSSRGQRNPRGNERAANDRSAHERGTQERPVQDREEASSEASNLPAEAAQAQVTSEAVDATARPRRGRSPFYPESTMAAPAPAPAQSQEPVAAAPTPAEVSTEAPAGRRARGGRKSSTAKPTSATAQASTTVEPAVSAPAPVASVPAEPASAAAPAAKKAARKSAPRNRKPRAAEGTGQA